MADDVPTLRLPQPVPIVVGNDERIAFIVAQIANEGLVAGGGPEPNLAIEADSNGTGYFGKS